MDPTAPEYASCEYGCGGYPGATLAVRCKGRLLWYGQCEQRWNQYLEGTGGDLSGSARFCDECQEPHAVEAVATAEGTRAPSEGSAEDPTFELLDDDRYFFRRPDPPRGCDACDNEALVDALFHCRCGYSWTAYCYTHMNHILLGHHGYEGIAFECDNCGELMKIADRASYTG